MIRTAADEGEKAEEAPGVSARPLLSIVSPVYRGEPLVEALVSRIVAAVEPITVDFEIVLVNDGSPDASWARIREACAREPRVVGINLSRNFGQHPAIRAGLRHTRGEWVVVMDCDLQDRPEEIPRLLEHAREHGHDIVLARRAEKQFGPLKRLSSRLFYGVLARLTGIPQDPAVANFGVYRRPVVDAVNAIPQRVGFFPALVQSVGFESSKLDVEHAAREEGESSYGLRALLALAINVIIASSDRPLYLVVYMGLGVSMLGFVYGVWIVYRAFTGQTSVEGWASLMVSIWFLAGIIISVIGVVGVYVGRIFDQTQQRPFFIVSEVLGGDGA